MSAQIFLKLDSAMPPYEQIRAQVASLISLGELKPGGKLPTVRALATDLGVATGTVARAYKELEAGGLISSRRRAGTVVNELPAQWAPEADLVAAVDRVWELARAQGIDPDTVKALLARRER